MAGRRTALAADGIDLLEGVEVARVEPGPTLVLSDGRRVAGSHLLLAAGRVPNLDGLGLEAGGVTASARGIATDAGLRSVSNRRVFAAGDIADPVGIGPRLFTHVGSYHAGIVVRRAIFRLPAKLDYAALPRVTFTDPELAQVGMTEAEVRAAGSGVAPTTLGYLYHRRLLDGASWAPGGCGGRRGGPEPAGCCRRGPSGSGGRAGRSQAA